MHLFGSRLKTVLFGCAAVVALSTAPSFAADTVCLITKTDTNPFFVKMKEGATAKAAGHPGADRLIADVTEVLLSRFWEAEPGAVAEEFTADGWFKTGDVGLQDARGYVTIVGRSKDLIISGGYNVYPAEIEGYLNDMPGVAESAIVGVPHPDFGEVGVAVVIAKPGARLDADGLVGALKAKLANFKIPKRCFIASELPRNTMGKVQKNLLRDQYKALFDPS